MHYAHDYRRLIQRWRAVASQAGVRLRRLVTVGRADIFFLRTAAFRESGGVYLSAAIHGDEPASSEALIAWAEEDPSRLRNLPALIFPCLNPWGLSRNIRTSEEGDDLNRCFHRGELPLIQALQQAAAGCRFSAALMLHEDYDAQGLYLYEIQRSLPYWGESFIEAARGAIPIEGRVRVDGRIQRGGVVRRRFNMRRFEEIGVPEAIWLHCEHSDRSFTIETPSEYALPQRVAAHKAIIDECFRLCGYLR